MFRQRFWLLSITGEVAGLKHEHGEGHASGNAAMACTTFLHWSRKRLPQKTSEVLKSQLETWEVVF